ncbi:glycerol dehydrogenase [Reticulomyxa filosa]|uniref:Glycerol dehydrogenase n=1 Tax=Reticulomyxa filosa TaxID=46433 RepID=X6N4T3_RETFI|nr:glycerol dehydrogenase [Reticulomyxa filosa]|eukprot:ETO21295.1 glycerol dehydrogenase [Reticulomyxa filosa]
MYEPNGKFKEPRCFPSNPDLVVVDSESIAQAPVRYLVAGIGDAMSTYYEARCCFENEKATNMVGARPTLTALALGELCCKILFESGIKAREAVLKQQVTPDLEKVIEANTLLSGVGFESGGLACAHAIAQGLTASKHIEKNFMHGEMVAAGFV